MNRKSTHLIVPLRCSSGRRSAAMATPQQDKMKACNAEAKGKDGG